MIDTPESTVTKIKCIRMAWQRLSSAFGFGITVQTGQ